MTSADVRRYGREQADRMLELVYTDPGPDSLLFDDPLAALADHPGVELVMSEADPDVHGDCSIAGHYRPASGGKVARITVMSAKSVRRAQFTALHEFGHHLQQNDGALADALFAYPDNASVEEAACDAFAAGILLPPDLVQLHLSDRGPDAVAVRNLYENSRASRAACAVAASQTLKQPGVVVVISPEGEITFAAPSGSIAPPKRGTDASQWPLFAMAQRSGHVETSVAGEARIIYSTGSQSQTLYTDVTSCAGHYVAVMTVGGAAWAPFSPPRDDWRGRPGRWWTCEYCTDNFEVGDRCSQCDQPRCPAGHCECTSKRERRCSRCGLMAHSSRFARGSDECGDCRG